MPTIKAREIVSNGFPTEEGRKLAQALLERQDVENVLSTHLLDLTELPSALLISAFFNAYLQSIWSARPELLDVARRTNWNVRFPFQEECVARWMKTFEPNLAS